MKLFFILLLISTSSPAVTFSQLISSPEGSSVVTFEVNKGRAKLVKKSNFFDSKIDYALGTFTLSDQVGAEEKVLLSNLAKIKEVNELLKKKNMKFNDLSQKKPHQSFFAIDSFWIGQQSELYPELKKVFASLEEKSRTQIKGIRLSSDLKTVSSIKNGKVTLQDKFNFQFHCKNPSPPTYCMFKDEGILFVK